MFNKFNRILYCLLIRLIKIRIFSRIIVALDNLIGLLYFFRGYHFTVFIWVRHRNLFIDAEFQIFWLKSNRILGWNNLTFWFHFDYGETHDWWLLNKISLILFWGVDWLYLIRFSGLIVNYVRLLKIGYVSLWWNGYRWFKFNVQWLSNLCCISLTLTARNRIQPWSIRQRTQSHFHQWNSRLDWLMRNWYLLFTYRSSCY